MSAHQEALPTNSNKASESLWFFNRRLIIMFA